MVKRKGQRCEDWTILPPTMIAPDPSVLLHFSEFSLSLNSPPKTSRLSSPWGFRAAPAALVGVSEDRGAGGSGIGPWAFHPWLVSVGIVCF